MPKLFIPGDRLTQPIAPQAEHHESGLFRDKLRKMGMEMHIERDAIERAITGAATVYEAQKLRNRLRRRFVQEGFPKISPFQSKDEIDRYLKGSPSGHTCLICGNVYRHLGMHLAKLHGVDLDEYRDHYHLPRTFGLASEKTKALHREVLGQAVAAGKIGGAEQIEMMRRKTPAPGTTKFAYKRAAQSERQTKYGDADFWRIIEVMRSETVTLMEVLSRPGMPSANSFNRWKAKHKEAQIAFIEAVDALPFPKQAAIGMLGDRYNQTILALRREGKMIGEISAIVGVNPDSINTRLGKLDPNHKKIVRHRTHCQRGHLLNVRFTEDGKRITRCRICDAENSRKRKAGAG